MPICSSWAITVGDGGAPAVVIRSGRSRGWACSAFAMVEHTAGAPHRLVTPRLSMASQIASARTARRQMWVPAAAVSARGVHQTLQWSIGSVHRYLLCPWKLLWEVSPSEFRYAPRWVYIAPLGLPVVPDV